MASPNKTIHHATNSTNLADLLERILDKGIVISGDIRINLVDIELLTIQIRLVICSVDRAVEMGMDWWRNEARLVGPAAKLAEQAEQAKVPWERMEKQLEALEARFSALNGERTDDK